MEFIVTLLIGAALGWFGHREYLKRKTKPEDAGVTIQGGGGPGEEPGP
jgi:hypothetical protein